MPKEHDLLEGIPDAVVVSDRDGKIVYANMQAESLTGYGHAELIGRKVEILVPAGLRVAHVQHRRRFYARGVARLMGGLDDDFQLRRKDGSAVPVEISLGPVGDDTVAVIRDFSERRRMELALEHRALHDPLTDIGNRTLFFDRLRQSLLNARRERGQVAIVMLDVDGFKAVNDAYGHATGDGVLKQLADRLKRGRATDTAARLGGDEFAWILPRVSGRAGVQRMVRRRLNLVQQPVVVEKQSIPIHISAGIAIYPDDGRDVDRLIRRADSAMYTAKRDSRAAALNLSGDR
ncbi:MAG TPA: sensor domain-containing diguanylate cyclase [Candidatus Sulfotelmatobacter sp.]|nr:sensor domain-containing diguanylate cyclase [Candidatus Sulfotelmatobacter sp.]